MIKSIKGKFTLTLTLVLFSVVILFATVVYFVNVNIETPITPQVLEEVALRNPRVAILLSQLNQNQLIADVFEIVREEQVAKYKTIYIILIPPALLLSGLIAYVVSKYLLKPVEVLSENLKHLGSHNISQRLPVLNNSTEINLLSTSFNSLLDELEEAFKVQDQFLQDAAHELRTPVAAIKTNIQVFNESKDKTIEDYQKLVEIIERINNKLVKLNENLLFLNRQIKGKYNFENSDVNEVILDVLDTVSILAENKGIDIVNNINEKLIAFIDPGKLSIAIKNIIENAIKYSKNNSQIFISGKKLDNKICIEVKDNGIGIKKSEIPRVFDRFYRAENINPNNQEGDGLGLAIVKKIIDDHNASIEIRSSVKIGTTVKILLPISDIKKVPINGT